MKILKNIFAFALALALITPSFALSAELTEDRDYGKIILTDNEKKEIYDLLDDTMAKQKVMAEELQKFISEVNKNKAKKRKQAIIWLMALSVPVGIVPVVISAGTSLILPVYTITHIAVKANKDKKMNEDNLYLEHRYARYEKIKKVYLDGEASLWKMDKERRGFIKALANFFLDDPASTFDMLSENKNLFLDMMESNSKVIKMLENYNKVITADPEEYSDFAVKNLASARAGIYFERLAEYLDIQSAKKELAGKTQKELVRSLKDIDNSKARRVAIKEIKKQDYSPVSGAE